MESGGGCKWKDSDASENSVSNTERGTVEGK